MPFIQNLFFFFVPFYQIPRWPFRIVSIIPLPFDDYIISTVTNRYIQHTLIGRERPVSLNKNKLLRGFTLYYLADSIKILEDESSKNDDDKVNLLFTASSSLITLIQISRRCLSSVINTVLFATTTL